MKDVFLSTTLGKNISDVEISKMLAEANSSNAWQRVIFQLARELDKFPASYKNEDFLVKGCDSNVWLVFKQIEDHIYFLADADSRVLKGLLVVLLTPINGIKTEDFSAFEQNVYLSQLPLDDHLTDSELINLRSIEDEISTIFQGLNF